MSRVFITAASVTTPIGCTVEDFYNGIANKKKGIIPIPEFNAFPINFGGAITEFNNQNWDRKHELFEKTLEQLFAAKSSVSAFPENNRILSVGAGIDYFDIKKYIDSDDSKKNNWRPYSKNSYQMLKVIAEQKRIRGGTFVNVAACVASSQAMGLAYRILKKEPQKIIITGGVDSMLNHLHFMGFYKLGALTTWRGAAEDSCRPFDINRCGIALGEGCALFAFQNEATIGASEILAEICGYASSIDAYSVTDPDPEGTAILEACASAINEAGISADEIDAVHLHGTGTIKNDIAEANAIKKIFGGRYSEVPVFSLKGQTGHLISACGAVEMLAVLYSLKYQKMPVTVNCEKIDPALGLRVIQQNELKMKIKYILKLNAAFGGQNTAFVVKYAN